MTCQQATGNSNRNRGGRIFFSAETRAPCPPRLEAGARFVGAGRAGREEQGRDARGGEALSALSRAMASKAPNESAEGGNSGMLVRLLSGSESPKCENLSRLWLRSLSYTCIYDGY